MNQEYFKTKNGTELPILNLKGKPYLQVAHRMIWFREERPLWSIETEQLVNEKDYSIFKCTIKDETNRVIATAHGREDYKHFLDAMEKSETKSIGRALALCGYGTQFAEVDFDEMPIIVDSPIMPAKPLKPHYSAAKVEKLPTDAELEAVKKLNITKIRSELEDAKKEITKAMMGRIPSAQKEEPVFAPNPMLRLQEAAKANAWSGESMRIIMQAKFGKMLVKELTEKEIATLCDYMKANTFAQAQEELKIVK